MTDGRRITAIVTAAGAGALCLAASATAQTRTMRDTATAYGARLDAKGEPADLNQNRNNTRLNSRLDTRLRLRIERYRPDSVTDTTAAFATQVTDNARVGTAKTLPSSSQTEGPSSLQDSPQSALPDGTKSDDDAAQPDDDAAQAY